MVINWSVFAFDEPFDEIISCRPRTDSWCVCIALHFTLKVLLVLGSLLHETAPPFICCVRIRILQRGSNKYYHLIVTGQSECALYCFVVGFKVVEHVRSHFDLQISYPGSMQICYPHILQ